MRIFNKKRKMLAVAVAMATTIGSADAVFAAPDDAVNANNSKVVTESVDAAKAADTLGQEPAKEAAKAVDTLGQEPAKEAVQSADTLGQEPAKEAAQSADTVSQKLEKEAAQGTEEQSTAEGTTSQEATAQESEEIDVNSTRYKWLQVKPSEEAMQEAFKKYEGRTLVSVDVKGASDDIIKAANVAVRSNPGDILSAKLLQRDMNRLMDTGYFYDMYVSFREVPEGVAVTYNVLENPMLTSVEIVGNSDVMKTERLEEKITLKPGQRLNRRILHENMTAIQQMYVEDGYVMAKVNGLDVKDDGKLVIRINEGTLEGYSVKGNKKTRDYVILREMRCKVGEPLNRNLLQRSYQRVNNLGFFESVDMKPVPGVEPNAVVIEIDVKEKNTGTFGIGMGYSSSEGFVGMISLGDRNFRGTGDYLGVTLEIGASDRDNRGWSISYRHPWLDKRETSLSLRVFDRKFRYDDYDTNGDLKEEYMRSKKGFEVTFGRPQTEYTSNYLTLSQVDDRYDKHRNTGDDRGTKEYADWRKKNFGVTRYIKLSHVTDTRDNYMYPMNGRQTIYSFTYAGLGGDFTYQKYDVDETRFYQVGHAQVFAIRGVYGYSPQSLPESAQYRIGGQDTVRGYRDDQFRGNAAAILKVEYRFPITKVFKGAIFSDCGGAWYDGMRPRDFHASIGVGMSVDTPMGALRLDIGRGSQGSRVHFNIGNAF